MQRLSRIELFRVMVILVGISGGLEFSHGRHHGRETEEPVESANGEMVESCSSVLDYFASLKVSDHAILQHRIYGENFEIKIFYLYNVLRATNFFQSSFHSYWCKDYLFSLGNYGCMGFICFLGPTGPPRINAAIIFGKWGVESWGSSVHHFQHQLTNVESNN